MRRFGRLRFQALILFAGLACLYASLSPFAIAQMGYTAEEIRACRQILETGVRFRSAGLGVDWPRNGLTSVLVECPFIAVGRALRGPESGERELALYPVLETAALVTLLFVWASRLSGSRRVGFWLAMAAAFCTMLWPYAYIGLETTQSLFLLAAGYVALTASPRATGRQTIAFAVFAAIAVSAKSAGFALVPVVAYLAWAMLRRQPVRLVAVGAAIAIALVTNQYFRILSWARFGGTKYVAQAWRPHDPISSLAGLAATLVSPTKGLLVFAPLAALAIVLVPACFRREPRVAIFAVLTLLGCLAPLSLFRYWADETWGPRYLHSAVAPLLLCLAPPLRGRQFAGALRAALLVGAAGGLAVSFLGAMFYYGNLGFVAMRATPLTLQALQGDPTWNHVDFNARLFATWIRSRDGDGRPTFVPRPDRWDYYHPDRKMDWTDVDLRTYAVPQPLLLQSLASGDRFRRIRRLCPILLIAGVFLLVAAGRASTLAGPSILPAVGAADDTEPKAREVAVASDRSAPNSAQSFDALLRLLGFDSERPGWFPALRDLHRHSRNRRLQLLPDFFYAPVFSPADLPAEVWGGTFPDCGTWDLDAQRAFLKETPSFAAELSALPYERAEGDPTAYYWGNEQFSHSDGSLYYSLIRRFRPARIVEVGAGHSTKLAARAVRANGTGRILCIDPHAPEWLARLEAPVDVQALPVQEAPDEIFLGLGASDILFIDGSHISKTGSDVNHLFLRILPRLPAGVLVHVHDICLPFEYPRYWSEEALCYWNEQYVLAALLANSTKYEILVGVHYLQKADIEALRPFVPAVPGVMAGGGSLWLRSKV